MTGSPFSLVLGTDGNSSTFKNVETTQIGDTTDDDRVGTDNDTESSVGVEMTVDHITHVAGQDETAGQSDVSGTPSS